MRMKSNAGFGVGVLLKVISIQTGVLLIGIGGNFVFLGASVNSLLVFFCEYDGTRAYALSKLANVLHTKELARRLEAMEANVTVNCVHPGIVRTRLTRDREGLVTDLAFLLVSKLLKTIPQAAATTCYVGTNQMLLNASGKYYSDCNEASTSRLGSSLAEGAKLWAASEMMVSGQIIQTIY
ncbi:hypothetical protein OROMI_009471 [Orobanche minor]